jgi:HEPN domain-containing protein
MNESQVNKVVAHWIESADRDYKTMNNLFLSKDYAWALFVGHLVIEKLIKALHVRKNHSEALFIHDLQRLMSRIEIEITEDQKKILNTITSFNLKGRYADYKNEFYKKCNEEFTSEWIRIIKETRLWIKELLK